MQVNIFILFIKVKLATKLLKLNLSDFHSVLGAALQQKVEGTQLYDSICETQLHTCEKHCSFVSLFIIINTGVSWLFFFDLGPCSTEDLNHTILPDFLIPVFPLLLKITENKWTSNELR